MQGARRALVSLSLAALLAAACASVAFAFRSERFHISEVDVDGASPAIVDQIGPAIALSCRPPSAEQRPSAGQSPSAGPGPTILQCNPHDPLLPSILVFNTAELRAEIERIPAVKSASVRGLLPNRLAISIEQRRPEAAWVVGPTVYRVAADGTVIDSGSPEGLKVVVGSVEGPPIKPGDRVDPRAIRGAEELQTRLPAELNIPVKRIEYSATNGLAVIGEADVIAMFGEPDNLGLKMAELQRILQLAKDKKTTPAFVDLRYKTPYYRTR
ncbi:MAG: FtsQ-type POTRA domain-containing protein [Chloroflexota bacterium]|nr:FtsQ-type POTRA domain-containing protein [Chloroflexota bacterium]